MTVRHGLSKLLILALLFQPIALIVHAREAKVLDMRSKYAGEQIPYFDDLDVRDLFELKIVDGVFVNRKGQPFTSGDCIFVQDEAHRIFQYSYSSHSSVHHSSLVSGKKIRMGGHLTLYKGELTKITNFSGHYQPPVENFFAFLDELDRHGVDLSDVQIRPQADSMYEFLKHPLDEKDLAHMEKYNLYSELLTRIDHMHLPPHWLDPYSPRILENLKRDPKMLAKTLERIFDRNHYNPEMAHFLLPALELHPELVFLNQYVSNSLSGSLKEEFTQKFLSEFKREMSILKNTPKDSVDQNLLRTLLHTEKTPEVENEFNDLFKNYWFKDRELDERELHQNFYSLRYDNKPLHTLSVTLSSCDPVHPTQDAYGMLKMIFTHSR